MLNIVERINLFKKSFSFLNCGDYLSPHLRWIRGLNTFAGAVTVITWMIGDSILCASFHFSHLRIQLNITFSIFESPVYITTWWHNYLFFCIVVKLQTLQWLRFHFKILIADQRGGENSDSDSDDPEVVQNALKEITPAFDVESDEAHLDVTLEEEITFLRQYREMIMTKNQWEKRVWVEFLSFWFDSFAKTDAWQKG